MTHIPARRSGRFRPRLDRALRALLVTAAAGAPTAVVPAASASAAFLFVEPAAAQQPPVAVDEPGERTLTLDEAIRIALTRSPTLQQADAQRIRDGASEWEGWDRLLPSLNFSTGLNQNEILQRTVSDPITGGIIQLPDSLIDLRQTFGTQAALSASWTLFDGGRNIQNVRRARAEGRAADFAFDAAHARVAATVTIAYLNALEAAATEAVLRAEVNRSAELERTAVGRFEVGEVPEVDALQARLTASDAEINLMEAESASYTARLALFEHLQIAPGSGIALAEPPDPDLSALPSEEVLRELASERSAQLAAQGARLEAAERGVDAQRWWFLPSVTVGANWIRSEFGQTRDALTFSPRNEQTYYRLNFSWSPLERPGGTIAERRRTQGNFRVARAELALQEAALVRGVETALDRLSRARALRERSEINLRLAERQRQQADERYRLGVAPLVERLNADALAAEAARQAIVARYAALRALAELEQAAGTHFGIER
jgi:outer membrane protein